MIKEGLEAAGFTVYGAREQRRISGARRPSGVGSWEFFDKLLTEANVITTPGAGFGPSGEGYVRLTAFGDADATGRGHGAHPEAHGEVREAGDRLLVLRLRLP